MARRRRGISSRLTTLSINSETSDRRHAAPFNKACAVENGL
jgi:hypothetical protein